MYKTPEQFLIELKEKLEEELMDLAQLKQKAIKTDHYPTASKFRDIELKTLKFLDSLTVTEEAWTGRY